MQVIPTSHRAPIALFVYNRPKHTKDTINALKKNVNFENSRLFVFSDGPNFDKAGDEERVDEVRDIVKNIEGFLALEVIEQKKNIGLASSILNGVTSVFEKYDRIIVIEDDIITSKGFLNFLNRGLELYSEVKSVMHISGYMHPLRVKLPSSVFYRVPSCWGWGTWRDRWELLERDPMKILVELENSKLLDEFDLGKTKVFLPQLEYNISGRMKTWAILWYGTVFINQGLCLHPGKSLVKNIGHDGTGEHCGKDKTYEDQFIVDEMEVSIKSIVESKLLVKEMKKFYRFKGLSWWKFYAKRIFKFSALD